ncbi:16S rRNA (guanine(966)-N(2))-methyltransferase RsmD [Undibacterium sp. CY7W]|uniref:16S rRNA (Guanine(966)-N(2))-methyltransferase RsmD n=1 Tax=Undibacterium rugosum TaxID=2762291 RepID=A0A923KRP5_9BURK|nr:16S rRNA (guanine(966)-N(2))-methyltransferase RsmD [Undibacterium rugosum]MBC3934069.1 16S rRNA (guanine(966)-N(2))-methyltransferase RsmD [Undibacterium rugosum]
MQTMKTTGKKNVAPKRATHQIRIIGGQWKRSVLSVIEAEGLRPTPDRVRETAFNWLNHLFDAYWTQRQCLDLFAGSGALGFEAASRGAQSVTMVENHTQAYQQLAEVKSKLGAEQCQLLRSDAQKAIAQLIAQGKQYDLIFLDPPFGKDWLHKMLSVCQSLLLPKGLLYVEAEFALNPESDDAHMQELLRGWQLLRADKAGSVYFHLLQRSNLAHETHEIKA